MHIFSFFIEDDRYSVPTLEFVNADDVDEAQALAAIELRASPHHLSIEAMVGGRTVFSLQRKARFDETDRAVHG